MYSICVYKGNEYNYFTDHPRYKKEVIQARLKDNKGKIPDGFISEYPPYYYKPVSKEELTDIYDYYFIIEYDAHLIKHPGRNEFLNGENGYESINSETFLISAMYDWGDEGWKCVDRDTYVKSVKYSEMNGARIRLVYQKKDGIECNPPVVIDKSIEPEEIYRYYKYYTEL